MCKIKKGDRVFLKKDPTKKGTVNRLLPHPFAPAWISPPNYLVFWDDNGIRPCKIEPDVLTKSQIKLLKPPNPPGSFREKLHKIFHSETELFNAIPQM